MLISSSSCVMQGTPLSTSALLRLGGAPGDDLGAEMAPQECGHTVANSHGEGSRVRVSYPDPASRDKKEAVLHTSLSSQTSDPPVRPGGARLCPGVPGRARLSGASRVDSDHQPSRAGHQDGIRLVKGPNSLKLLLFGSCLGHPECWQLY